MPRGEFILSYIVITKKQLQNNVENEQHTQIDTCTYNVYSRIIIGINHVDKSTEIIYIHKVTFLNALLHFQESLQQFRYLLTFPESAVMSSKSFSSTHLLNSFLPASVPFLVGTWPFYNFLVIS